MSNENLPREIGQFQLDKKTGLSPIQIVNQQLAETRQKDYAWRVNKRPFFGYSLLALLFLQNVAVFLLVFLAFFQGGDVLTKLQPVISILVTGTIAGTAYSINLIIKWLFNEINYQFHKD